MSIAHIARIYLAEGQLSVQLDADKMSVQRTPPSETDRVPVESLVLTGELWDQLVEMRKTAVRALAVATEPSGGG